MAINGGGTDSRDKHEAIESLWDKSDKRWHAIVRNISIQAPLSQRVPAQIALAENIPAKLLLGLTVYTTAYGLSREKKWCEGQVCTHAKQFA